MVAPKRPQFVLFGSSIVQISYSNGGWGAHLADIYSRKADIVLRGYNGWNSRRALEVVHQVFPKDAAIQPDLVVVYFGGNDSMDPHPSGLSPHVPLPEYVENMRSIAIHLTSLSDQTRIIFLSCLPVNEEQFRSKSKLVRSNEACQRYSEACIQLCRDMRVKVIDLYTALQKTDNWKTSSFTDGAHLSSGGSKIVVDEILKVLKEAEWEPSLYWKSLPSEFAENPLSAHKEDTINADEWTLYRENWH